MIWPTPEERRNKLGPLQDRRVLVLDADSRAGLACLQSLGAAGVKLHAGLRKKGSLTERSRWCRVTHLQPSYEPAEPALAWLSALDAEHGYALVIPATEGSLRWLRLLPESHPLRRKAQLASDASLDIALDKDRTCEQARALGIAIPLSRRIDAGEPIPPALGFPCVLKPLRSKVLIADRLETIAVVVARDAKTRDATFSAWLPYTGVQEQAWVPGRGVGVEALYQNGEPVCDFIHERLHEYPLQGGASTLRRAAAPDPALLEQTHRLLRSLHWHGVAMVEWRRSPDGSACLMEINPRLWGSLPLTIAAGVDIPAALLDMACGNSLPKQSKPSWRVGLRARNMTEDLRWLAANMRADRQDPLLLTESPAYAALGWFKAFGGGERWDGWRLNDPAVATAEVGTLARNLAKALGARLLGRLQARRLRRHHRDVMNKIRRRGEPIKRVLFLCYGNICRSPFAERLAAHRLPGVVVESSGFHPKSGRQSPRQLIAAAKEFGVDLSDWRSQIVTAEQIKRADIIFVMDTDNFECLRSQFPGSVERATFLGLLSPMNKLEIEDPYSLSFEQTRHVLSVMIKAMDGLKNSDVIAPSVLTPQ